MLLRFTVRNYRSIGEEQELSFVASSLADNEAGLIEIDELKYPVLPSLAIYGANASGKSNILKALRFFWSGILGSYKTPVGKSVKRQPFLLDGLDNPDTSFYEADFLVDIEEKDETPKESGESSFFEKKKYTRFTYGFILSDNGVVEEWLYAYPKQYRQVWFHRNINEAETYYFGKELKGQNKLISSATREHALFLSTAIANNHKQLKPIYEYFESISFNLNGFTTLDEDTLEFLEHDRFREMLLAVLKQADVGICEARIETIKRPEKITGVVNEISLMLSQSKYLEDHERAKIRSNLSVDEKKVIKFGHRNKESVVFLPLEDESRGTIAFMNLISWIFGALAQGQMIVIDELDSSLHPLLCRKIVELFNNKATNPNNAQLLFSTHDTTLLSTDLIRRDQVWLAQKDNLGLSRFYPLSDLKLRKGDNLQKGYLEGKFGAIPFLGDFQSVLN